MLNWDITIAFFLILSQNFPRLAGHFWGRHGLVMFSGLIAKSVLFFLLPGLTQRRDASSGGVDLTATLFMWYFILIDTLARISYIFILTKINASADMPISWLIPPLTNRLTNILKWQFIPFLLWDISLLCFFLHINFKIKMFLIFIPINLSIRLSER